MMAMKVVVMTAIVMSSTVVLGDDRRGGNSEGSGQQSETEGVGTNIYGEAEQAAGLYLVPWENSQASDVDRPPSLLDAPMTDLNVEEFERYAQWVKERKAYRLWRLHRNNW